MSKIFIKIEAENPFANGKQNCNFEKWRPNNKVVSSPCLLGGVVPRLLSAFNMVDSTNSITVLYDRAKLLQSNGCHNDALKELNKVIGVAEQYKEETKSMKRLLSCAWNDRGHLKYLQVNFEDAISDYTRAIELDNDFAVPYYNRGQVHYRMGT